MDLKDFGHDDLHKCIDKNFRQTYRQTIVRLYIDKVYRRKRRTREFYFYFLDLLKRTAPTLRVDLLGNEVSSDETNFVLLFSTFISSRAITLHSIIQTTMHM